MSSDVTQSAATKLKDEGNALFAKKDYQAALNKYSQAMQQDAENAILFANRAACALQLEKYVHANLCLGHIL